jgi:dihydropteroate synthase
VVVHEWHLPKQTLQIGRPPLVMGIVNVTPDSFSDGGLHMEIESALAHGRTLIQQGADILDIGGESTRPGATPVPVEEELRRVLPVVKQLAAEASIPLSVDTYKAETARACLAAGAQIINDITGLTGDPAMAEVVRVARAGVIVMHMQGTPATMQINPQYDDVVADVGCFLETRLQQLTSSGIARTQIVLDPGIGFGKTLDHNFELLAGLSELQRLGRPICLGVSRKGFLGKVSKRPVQQRLAGSVAAVLYAVSQQAAQIVRVHDVMETQYALAVFEAIRQKSQDRGGERIGKEAGAAPGDGQRA